MCGAWSNNTKKRHSNILSLHEAKHRGKPQYSVGDEVLVYWSPFRAYIDIERKYHLRNIGLFKVVRIIGDNTVELDGLPGKMPRVLNTEYVHLYRRDYNAQLAAQRHSPQPPRLGQPDGDKERKILVTRRGSVSTGWLTETKLMYKVK